MLEPMTEPVSLDDFAVLPGESLAKYSGRPPGEEPEADESVRADEALVVSMLGEPLEETVADDIESESFPPDIAIITNDRPRSCSC